MPTEKAEEFPTKRDHFYMRVQADLRVHLGKGGISGEEPLDIAGEIVQFLMDGEYYEEYHQSRLSELREKVEEKLEHHAKERDETDKDFEYAHHHGIVEGMVKVLQLLKENE